MKKLLLIILLTAISTSAMAEWSYIMSDDSNDYYFDRESIHKKGNIVSMWGLRDLKTPEKNVLTDFKMYSSLKTGWQYDCMQRKTNISSLTFYSENMGAGMIIFSHRYNKADWSENSIGDFLKEACNKK
jgi:hypothetical protein